MRERKERVSYLFDVEACPDVDEHVVGVGELAFDVEGVGEGDEDGFFFCLVLCCFVSGLFSLVAGRWGEEGVREGRHALSNDDDPDWTTRRHSLNLARAAASWA